MRLRKTSWIALSGIVWFVVGFGLLTLGLRFVVEFARFNVSDTTSLIAQLTPIAGGREQAAMALIMIGLIIGFIKGRFVLVKTVRRVTERILKLPEPVKFNQVYSRGYLFLIAGMIALGVSMKWLHVPQDIRGMVDVAVGSALMNGAMLYFRLALTISKEQKQAR
ncbi:MAG: hypothetical protein V4492_03040 [Chlamydiota bacterium]